MLLGAPIVSKKKDHSVPARVVSYLNTTPEDRWQEMRECHLLQRVSTLCEDPMTLTLTVTLSPEAEAELRAGIAARDAERVRQVLAGALEPSVATLLQQVTSQSEDDQEWEAALDELADSFASSVTPETPVLSDYAMSRAGIYEEHP